MATKLTIGFLGAGQNGHRPGARFRPRGCLPKEIIAGDCVGCGAHRLHQRTGAKTTVSNSDVLKFASVLILA